LGTKRTPRRPRGGSIVKKKKKTKRERKDDVVGGGITSKSEKKKGEGIETTSEECRKMEVPKGGLKA